MHSKDIANALADTMELRDAIMNIMHLPGHQLLRHTQALERLARDLTDAFREQAADEMPDFRVSPDANAVDRHSHDDDDVIGYTVSGRAVRRKPMTLGDGSTGHRVYPATLSEPGVDVPGYDD